MELNKINFGADRYCKIIKKSKIICVDFDNTVCLDEWPFIGPIIPGAIEVLNAPPLKEHIGEIIYDEYDGNAEIADAVTEKVTNKVMEIIGLCKDFYFFNIDKQKFRNTLAFGATPSSNIETVKNGGKIIMILMLK